MPADRTLKFERSNHVLTFIRQFDASAEHVYRAHVEPDLIRKWLLGPPGWTMPECTHENRVGGKYRYVWANPAEEGFGVGGTILDLQLNARIVHTELFDGADMGGETVVTTHFAEEEGVTTMRMCVAYGDPALIDAAIESGMTEGMQMSYELLDDLLAA